VLRLLDLFCGAGGAGVGYARAGFAVTGVDKVFQPRYPFRFIQADALSYAARWGHKYDAIHASPPCQKYTALASRHQDREYPDLIGPTRDLLRRLGKPYVIENVEDARTELESPLLLCGRMFHLGAVDEDGTPLVLDRHRLFESNLLLSAPPHVKHDRTVQVAGAYSGARRDKAEARLVRKGGYVPKSLEVLRDLLGTPWMTEQGCFLSIPPAYTEHLGLQLAAQLGVAA
jgi:DNA (cytosine-5)-methyltransferase 1